MFATTELNLINFFLFGQDLSLSSASQIKSFSLALFASLHFDEQTGWPLFQSSYKDRGISLSVFPKDTTSELAGLLSTLSLLCLLPMEEYRFLTDPTRGNEPQVCTADAPTATSLCQSI